VTPPGASLIAEVEAIPVRLPALDPDDLDSSSETVVVRITDQAGRAGIGEADAPAPLISELITMEDRHAMSRGLRGMLLGREPFEIAALHEALYQGSIYHGRRGLGIHALSAVDIALHDLVGKQLGRPSYQLLGGARREAISPYATIYPGAVKGRSLEQVLAHMAELAERALELGFTALKLEAYFYDLVTDSQLIDCVRGWRGDLGPEPVLMVDFGYRWQDWRDALRVLSRLEDCALYFAEATLQHDDLTGHARLASRVETRIGGAEFAATLDECREWLERGQVDVLQPDISRCGGLTEIRRIAELAALHGASVIPHGWKTGITAAAARHFQAATTNSPYIEMFSPELFPSPLRAHLVKPEPQVHGGRIPLPAEPGLGVELDEETLARYRSP
jgi:L-alanine-DL-glutamate epimerase-like enolase superfamily enzyme